MEHTATHQLRRDGVGRMGPLQERPTAYQRSTAYSEATTYEDEDATVSLVQEAATKKTTTKETEE